MQKSKDRSLLTSALIPILMVAIMWLVYGLELMNETSYSAYGLLPRDTTGLRGIFFMPFLHGSFNHIVNNSLPFIVLGTMLYHFYPRVATRVILWSWVLSGVWLWVGARASFHIGASGLIYALGSFLFFAAIFAKNFKLMRISLLVVFLYGSLIWGIFPIKEGISWEGHLFGGLAGLMLAWAFRKEVPRGKVYHWADDLDQLEEVYGERYWDRPPQAQAQQPRYVNIRYVFRRKEEAPKELDQD